MASVAGHGASGPRGPGRARRARRRRVDRRAAPAARHHALGDGPARRPARRSGVGGAPGRAPTPAPSRSTSPPPGRRTARRVIAAREAGARAGALDALADAARAAGIAVLGARGGARAVTRERAPICRLCDARSLRSRPRRVPGDELLERSTRALQPPSAREEPAEGPAIISSVSSSWLPGPLPFDDAMPDVLIQETERNLVERCLDGTDLGEHVDAVAIVLDHLLDAAGLSFYALEAGEQLWLGSGVCGHTAMIPRRVYGARTSVAGAQGDRELLELGREAAVRLDPRHQRANGRQRVLERVRRSQWAVELEPLAGAHELRRHHARSELDHRPRLQGGGGAPSS